MPLSKLLTKSTLLFLSLNLVRVLSIVAICLVFAGEIYTMVSDVQGYNSASSAAQSPSTTSPGLGATASTVITRERLARREFVPVAFTSATIPTSSLVWSSASVALAEPTAAPVVSSGYEAGRMVKHRRLRRAASEDESSTAQEETSSSTRRVRTSTATSEPRTTSTSSFSTALPTATDAPYSPYSAEDAEEACAYVGGTSIPRTTGGVVFGTLQRIFTALILLFSFSSELPLPPVIYLHLSRFWTYAFPPFGPDFGPSVLGLVQVFVGSVVLARNNKEGSWTQVSGWLLFLVGILNFLTGLAFGRRSKVIRSFSADSTSPSALRRLRLQTSSSSPSSNDRDHHPEISSPFDDRHAPVASLSASYYQNEHEERQQPEMIAGPSFRPARQPSIKRSGSRNGPNGIVISPPRPLRPSIGAAEEAQREEVVAEGTRGKGREGALTNWAAGIDSDDEDDMQEDYRYTKQATLWAIEATDAMLAPTLQDAPPPDPTQPTPSATQSKPTDGVAWNGKPARSKMEECLRAAYATMKRKVISAPKDLVGIVVWNTQETKGVPDVTTEHCHVLLDLQQVDAQNIRKIKELLEKAEQDPEFLPNLFKPNEGQNVVAELFPFCNNLFRERSPSASNTVFLVTDKDDPIGEFDSRLFEIAKTRRKDLQEMGYAIEPFLIPAEPGAQFDLNKFWGGIITAVDDDSLAVNYPVVNLDLRTSLRNMISAMRLKEASKRVAFKIPFVLGQGLVIGVAGYNTIGEESKKLPTKVDLNTAAGEEVVSKTVYKDGETGSELNPKTDIKKYFQVGQSDFEKGIQAAKIFFTEADIRKVKTIGRPPSLKLLGFKPRKDNIKFHETIKHSYFIYPDEERYSGSTRTFAALLRSMIKKDVIGFASFVARTSSKPQVVLLIPQEEHLNSAGVADIPPGIHVCQLPFADDVREVNLDSTVSVLVPPGTLPSLCLSLPPSPQRKLTAATMRVQRTEPEADSDDDLPDQPAVDIAKKIIGGYSKKYVPDNHPNPAINYFYETLAAVALDEEIPEPEDKSLPQYHTIEQRVGKYISRLRALIPQDEIDPSRLKTSTAKRTVKKDTKLENAEPPDLTDFLELLEEKGAKITVPDLKKGLKEMGLPTSGNKADLLDRVDSYLKEHGLRAGGGEKGEDSEEEDIKPKVSKAKRRKVVLEDEESD
ncbi:hypothetical protein JCM11251_000398 [Rhodosporidiobolus azoricus]